MGLEGALFTFQLSTFEKTNLNFKYLTCNLFYAQALQSIWNIYYYKEMGVGVLMR